MKKTNKIISIILTVLMLMSAFPVVFAQAAAIEADYEIEFGKSLTVTAGAEGVYVKFVPEKSVEYIFRSESDDVDTCAALYDAEGEELGYTYYDDFSESFDFKLIYECDAGEEYYLFVSVYSENTETFDIVIDCGHNFDGDTCDACGEVCEHTEIGFLGFCLCGKEYLGKDITDGGEVELESKTSDDCLVVRFTPEVSGTYSLKSVSEDCDPDCYLYDSYNTMLNDSYDVNGMDFDLIYYLEAGESYYFDIHNCFGAGTFKVTLTRMVHSAADGSEHDLEYVEGTDSNCTEHGYTDGFYCPTCEKYISGHEKMPLDAEYHIDDDWDDICDLCGESTEYTDSDDSTESDGFGDIAAICETLANLSGDGMFGRLFSWLHILLHTLLSIFG